MGESIATFLLARWRGLAKEGASCLLLAVVFY
jgi:hypothetical protein